MLECSILICSSAPQARLPRGVEDRPARTGRVPSRDSEALHRRPDPVGAEGVRRTAGTLADDARVRCRPRRPYIRRRSSSISAAGTARSGSPGLFRAGSRRARSCWRSSRSWATSSSGSRRRATSTRTADECRRSPSTGTRSGRSRTRCARPLDQAVKLSKKLRRLPKFADWTEARKQDDALLTEWQIYRMFDARRGAWSTFQFLVRERLLEQGVDVAHDGTLK